ncbi:trimethylamine methyltransferase family protein [Desulfatitalea alkaliphila]|uniref:Trimethylamine methyltransferase family protein n=1 Tax=Desulfatitalea alkaliphila TaxID=2929485 RepID=A0AA41UPE0_9BACT|nr:trimethylamine methyltransferase family protein [Desulfatitalea alkaliphila]MCJ8500398.1 trimethylamine methyltransferase family protein [Desulfatitalea alkaliphila]
MQLPTVPTHQPRLKVFDRRQALAVHSAALEILEKFGVQMAHAGARDLLLANGARLYDEYWVRIPAHMAEAALRSAPRQILLYNQMGERAMALRDDHFYFGTGSDTTFTLDLESGQRRPCVLADTGRFARLVDALPNLSFAMSMSNPRDVPNMDFIYVQAFAEMVRNTNKPMVFIADRLEDMALIHQIACAVAGGEEALRRKPFLLNYSEAISPLRFPENVVDKLIFCARKEVPICLPSGSNAGGGAPITLAGAMALGIAENLAGLVIHQLTQPGAPFLFGPNVSALDMKSAVVSYGCPEWSLTQAALADMRDELYGLPIWSFAGATDAKTVDAQAGAEAMFSITTAMLSRCNLIHDVGYLEYGSTSSLEMVTLADELIGMARHFTAGIPVNPATLALDALERVKDAGAKGIFLTDDHTFDHFESALFLPDLLDRSRYDTWQAAGGPDLYRRSNDKVRRILAEHNPAPEKEAALLQQINQLLEAAR